MRVVVFCLLILSLNWVKAQEVQKSKWIVGPSLGYQYQEKSFLKGSVWALTDLGYANYLRFDAGADLTFQDKKAYVIPEFGVTYYLSAKGIWPFIKAEVTPYTLTPKIGFGLFNILEFGVGYGVKLNQKANLPPIKGFTLGVGLSLPLNYNLN